MRRQQEPLVIVGDVLLDRDLSGDARRLCPDAPVAVVDDPLTVERPGGAGLAAVLAARDGRAVTLVTALGEDHAGQRVAALLAEAGVRVVDLRLSGRTPEKVRVRAGGQSLVRLDYTTPRGTAGDCSAAARAAIASAGAVLVADYGGALTASASLRAALAEHSSSGAVVWDPHPRGLEPVPGVRLATPNRREAARLVPEVGGTSLAAVTQRATMLLRRWQAGGVVITTGERGALLVSADGTPLAVPAPRVERGDPCGAGDRFAVTAAGALADGALLSEAVTAAVASASTFVAAGGAAALDARSAGDRVVRHGPSAWEVAEATRRAGGSVVATGGCFDLLHAGHVHMLEAARRLGDCLIVCVNDDASVRRLKGHDRPLVPAADRVAVLRGLGCVDAVVLFEEDTPERLLEDLRPDVWAKGADYAVTDLPEAAVVRRWGGQAVVLPYVAGRSTTQLIKEAARRDSP